MVDVRNESLDFIVKKDDWRQTRFVTGPAPGDPAPGQVLFRVDRFAFTANNISYALAGDALGYWRFFPTEEGWGRLPTMGFGDVIRSAHPEVAVGTRCFGFFPMSRYLVIEPARVGASQIVDGAPHREGIALAYNQYTPTEGDALYSAEHEDPLMLMRGLFLTSFLVEDFLSDHDLYGARSVLISSASSKTSIALAYQVSQSARARAVGLTSPRNLDFVKNLGCYDQVLTYDEVASLPADAPVAFVDMAGDGGVVNALHRHFEDQMKYSCTVGATHWDAGPRAEDLPGPAPQFFFAPAQLQKRSAEWGAERLQQRLGAAWKEFRDWSDSWLRVVRGQGRDAVERVYRETLEGRTAPEQGQILSLWDDGERTRRG